MTCVLDVNTACFLVMQLDNRRVARDCDQNSINLDNLRKRGVTSACSQDPHFGHTLHSIFSYCINAAELALAYTAKLCNRRAHDLFPSHAA